MSTHQKQTTDRLFSLISNFSLSPLIMTCCKHALLVTLFVKSTWTTQPDSTPEWTFEESVKNSWIEPDDSLFKSARYEDIDYPKFLLAQETLITHSRLVKEIHLEDKYSDLVSANCGDKPCRTIMYEISNHNMHEFRKKSIPTILLVGGIHGNATIGVQALVELVRVAQKVFALKNQWYQLINNVRILVIPAINMNGLYNQTDQEIFEMEHHVTEVDPNFDFNLRPQHYCFTSLASQILSHVYNEYLIYGTLLLSKGNFEVKWPRLNQVLGVNKISADEVFLGQLAENLRHMFNYHADEDTLSNDDPDAPESNVNIASGRTGSYIEWAFGASAAEKYLSQDCFDRNSYFKAGYNHPTDASHRAIAIEIALDKTKVKGPLDKALGNEIWAVNPFSDHAKPGIIPALIITIQRFMEVLQPFVSLKELGLKHSPESGLGVDLQLEVYGEFVCNEFKIVKPESEKQAFDGLEHEFYTSQSYLVGIEARFLKHSAKMKKNFFELNLEIGCDSDIRNRIIGKSSPISHYISARNMLNYSVSNSEYTLTPPILDHFKIKHIRLGQLGQALVVENMITHSKIVYQKNFLMQVGERFPIRLAYNSRLSQIELQLLSSQFPQAPPASGFTEYMSEAGIVTRVTQSSYNKRLFDLLSQLGSDLSDLELRVFMDRQSFLCSQIDIDLLQKKSMDLQNRLSEQYKILNTSEDSQLDDLSESANSKELEYLRNQFESNRCNLFERGSHRVSKEGYLITLGRDTPVQILPAEFNRLLGRSVSAVFKVKPQQNPQSPIDSKSTVAPHPESRADLMQINGQVVMEDLTITGMSVLNLPRSFPSADQVIHTRPNEDLQIKHSSLSCSSLNPFQKVTTNRLRLVAQQKHQSAKLDGSFDLNSDDFFLLSIKVKNRIDNDGVLVLYTNSSSPSYVVYNKNQSFKLKNSHKSIQVRGEYGSQDINIYKAEFPPSQLALLGLYLLVYDTQNNNVVFDCFMAKNNGDLDVKTEYILFKSILEEIEEITKNDFTESSSWSWHREIGSFWMIIWWFVAFALLCLAAVLVLKFQFGYFKGPQRDLRNALDAAESRTEESGNFEKR